MSRELANRFREVILNGKFIANTNFKDQLEETSFGLVTTKIGSHNTISVLAQHIHYYISGVKNVLNGGDLEIKDQFSFDFPLMETEKQWNDFLSKFWSDGEEFAELVEKIPAKKLKENFVKPQYGTYHRNIDAMIEHCYYHLGQIVLLKKLISEDKSL